MHNKALIYTNMSTNRNKMTHSSKAKKRYYKRIYSPLTIYRTNAAQCFMRCFKSRAVGMQQLKSIKKIKLEINHGNKHKQHY